MHGPAGRRGEANLLLWPGDGPWSQPSACPGHPVDPSSSQPPSSVGWGCEEEEIKMERGPPYPGSQRALLAPNGLLLLLDRGSCRHAGAKPVLVQLGPPATGGKQLGQAVLESGSDMDVDRPGRVPAAWLQSDE
ncbi:hypothetical protein J1605_000813 [Eschrichtius robustus]|uniref:Uncharacterized protein n=1 Tax=Eschrichtius robustus TaxID=9764 RepID=A0AB34GPW9_ESCRO|nr:hypothetical protein J1605_000813 [Eschrichtius robustus]